MTRREIFERVKEHLLTQNKKSMSVRYGCAYRGRTEVGIYVGSEEERVYPNSLDGTKCAIGCLISDEHYSPDLEGEVLGDLCYDVDPVREAVERSLDRNLDEDDIDMLVELQRIHDMVDPMYWKTQLRNLEIVYFGRSE